MDRKTALRTLATTAVIPWLAPTEVAALLDARRSLAPRDPSQPLSGQELEIIGVVADIILPRTDTPSATDLGVPAFVELLVTEWMEEEEAAELRQGLTRLDERARSRFGAPFVACASDEQLGLVRELDDELPRAGDATRPTGFYPTLKRFVVTGYFTTPEGAMQTGHRLLPGMYAGCVVPGEAP